MASRSPVTNVQKSCIKSLGRRAGYSGVALSEVSPYPISHDSMSRWLNDQCFRPRDLWEIANKHVDSISAKLTHV